MTAAALAALHATCFTTPRPWTEAEFAGFLTDPLCDLVEEPGGFALIRSIAGETELLTIAVAPEDRRRGLGRAILNRAIGCARARGTGRIFLEVAADNGAAVRLYDTTGFARIGRRPAYYRKPDGARVDALIMALTL